MKNIGDFKDYAELLAAKAFVRLLTSGCLDPTTYENVWEFRAVWGLAVDMFSNEEKAVIRAAAERRRAKNIIAEAAAEIRQMDPRNAWGVTESDEPEIRAIQQVLDAKPEIRAILQDLNAARDFHPPTSMCSV